MINESRQFLNSVCIVWNIVRRPRKLIVCLCIGYSKLFLQLYDLR